MATQYTLPTINQKYVDDVLSEVMAMSVNLDENPLDFGPKRLQLKVAQCRQHLSRCMEIQLRVQRDHYVFKSHHRSESLVFDVKLQRMLASDPDVQHGRNMKDREAIANSKLRAERESLHDLVTVIGDLEMLLQALKMKREDLKDIQNRISLQHKLCQDEIGLGSKWGSRPAPEESRRVTGGPAAVQLTEDEFDVEEFALEVGAVMDPVVVQAPPILAAQDEEERDPLGEILVEEIIEEIVADGEVVGMDEGVISATLSDTSARQQHREEALVASPALGFVEEVQVPEADASSLIDVEPTPRSVEPGLVGDLGASSEVDDFLSELDVPDKSPGTPASPASSDVSLDDFFGF